MIKKYVDVLLRTLAYPFKHIKDISGVFLMTLAVYVTLAFISLIILQRGLGISAATDVVLIGTCIVLGLVIFLALMPLYVSVVRHIILGEKIESRVLSKMEDTREGMTLIAWSKLMFLVSAPILIGFIVMAMLGKTVGFDVDLGLGAGLTLEHIVLVLALVIALCILVRGCMMVIHSAIDKDSHIRHSFAVTKGHGLYLFLFIASLVLILSLITYGTMLVYGYTIGPWSLDVLLKEGPLTTLLITIVAALVDTLGGVILVAGLAKLYLVIAKN